MQLEDYGQSPLDRDGLGVVLLADAPIFSVACTPWRFLSQVPGYPKYDERQRDSHHIVSLVFAITQPSPLYVEWDFLFRILLLFLTKHMGQSFSVWVNLLGLNPHGNSLNNLNAR